MTRGGGGGGGEGGETTLIPKFLEGQAGVTIAQVACGDLFTGQNNELIY